MSGAEVWVKGLGKSFGKEPVLADMNLELAPGQSLALVGASGCGKTTVLRILAGICAYDRGEVFTGVGSLVCSLVAQDLGLFPWKTVLENLELPLTLAGIAKKEQAARSALILAQMGLIGLEKRFPAELSGGQRQKVAIGRALVVKPELLLLDEPFSALDAMTRESLGLHLAGLWADLGLTMILATHSIEEACFLGQTIAVLGGKPTGVRAVFHNPWPKTPKAMTEDYFLDLVRNVRLALNETWPELSELSFNDRES
jgi:NitT/TauT family transport system ATP-binding protein